MKWLRVLTASVLTMSMFGCVSGQNCVSDSCDPCGGGGSRGCGFGGGISRLWRGSQNSGCGCYQSCDACGACMGCGGGGDCMMDSGCASGNCGGAPSGSSCGCGNGNGSAPAMYPKPQNSQPTYMSPTPTETPPAVPGADPSARMQSVPQSQWVSYEEFQRLPGNVVSGPGATTAQNNVPASNVQQTSATSGAYLIPPPPAPGGMSPATQQAVWTPAK